MNSPSPQPHLVRLQRFLAACGLGSRRHCEEFILAGRVSVDGKTVTELGTKVDPQSQKIALDGETLRMERKKYYALNKPPGVLSTNRDPEGRPRVIDLFPPGGPRLFTVGRLDEDSEGLLLVTNDGDLAQKLAHPKFRIARRYELQVAGVPKPGTLAELRKGLYFTEGRFRVQQAKILKVRGQSAIVEAILTEGHNRELRRLFARVGHKVMKLKRVAFGPVQLGRLPRGEHRDLTRDELAELIETVQRGGSEAAGRTPQAKSPRKNSGRRTATR